MKKTHASPTLQNLLTLLEKRAATFSGESRRSYRKALASFRTFLVTNYPLSSLISASIIESWVVENYLKGLTPKTIGFYLDKIASLYSGIGHKLEGGKTSLFKEAKHKLKDYHFPEQSAAEMKRCAASIPRLWKISRETRRPSRIVEALFDYCHNPSEGVKDNVKHIWSYLALSSGIPADSIRAITGEAGGGLKLMEFVTPRQISEEKRLGIMSKVAKSIYGEEPRWYAMRLRPKMKYEHLIDRFSLISQEVTLPELFYPSEEIARRIGRKVVWTGKPVIRDVVFFKTRKEDIRALFSKIYDIAWCYRTPGGKVDDYASIPTKSMEDFKAALGILNPDFEIMPSGKMKLQPGDEVVIVNGEFMESRAKILKGDSTEGGNIIYRVALVHNSLNWEIGIDARWLKKV